MEEYKILLEIIGILFGGSLITIGIRKIIISRSNRKNSNNGQYVESGNNNIQIGGSVNINSSSEYKNKGE